MISVALAAYNGEKYIREQVDSILSQLEDNDELIISDNCSTDKTLEILQNINDKRIKIYVCEKPGVAANFTNALLNTNGDIIYLSDQDDVWMPDKIKKTAHLLNQDKPQLVVSNLRFVDAGLRPLGVEWKIKKGYCRNFIKNTYIGATFAFNRPFLNQSLPFPSIMPMHDWYMGLLAEKMNYDVIIVDEELLLYRRHGNNATGSKTTLKTKIKYRYCMLTAISAAVKRVSKNV